MLPSTQRSNPNYSPRFEQVRPSLAFIIMIFGALIAFEIFNYSTTDHALSDMLGNLTFVGIPWSTMLAIAFCGIDFAGIARLFTPEQGMEEPKEVWYLFGAWLLAATMNAILTWWGVSIAIMNHTEQSSLVVDPETIVTVVPVFVAIMVWLIRILIIGTLSLSVDRMLHPGNEQRTILASAMSSSITNTPAPTPIHRPSAIPASLGSASIPQRPALQRNATPGSRQAQQYSALEDEGSAVGEPVYHSLSGSTRQPAQASSKISAGNDRFRRS